MDAKANAAAQAVRLVRAGTTLGLGTGSTASAFIELLARENRGKALRLECVATSEASARLARRLGLKVVGLESVERIDLAVDGADQADAFLNLVKGGGGAHAREKVVDYAARKFVVIADESKAVRRVGGKIPLEILPFAYPLVKRRIQKEYGASTVMRMAAGKPVVSDNGNFLADADFGRIASPSTLEAELDCVPGMVANGLFTRNVSGVIIGSQTGTRWIGR